MTATTSLHAAPPRAGVAPRPAARRRPARASAPAPDLLDTLLADSRLLLSLQGEASSPLIAARLTQGLRQLLGGGDSPALAAWFEHLAADFNPDPGAVLASAQAYARDPGAATLLPLTQLAEPPRQELFRRLNRAPGGTATLIALRRALLQRLPRQPGLAMVEADLLHLLSSWFNPGFLEMRQVSWDSPAQLLEQIIRHEAVHAIDGWDDLRRRLQPDRRCFAFFHPQLPDEPLIFVEVALVPEMANAIAPLIDKRSAPLPPEAFKVAVFYSISNCQPGLRGVSLGNFLIKRVAERLQAEFPQLRRFCTLSPIPGFMAWLQRADAQGVPPGLKGAGARRAAADLAALQAQLGAPASWPAALVPPGADDAACEAQTEVQARLRRLAAHYLKTVSPTPGGDPVARFHLDNGARLERLNVAADLSPKGLRQSAGLMVNYLYDLARIDHGHARFTQGQVVASPAVTALLR
ncbi:malonyl-CoA decarboxylase [Ideonella livida]|uniref:Malonyl-CoA decarboxylase n=1 Tax=Ideonella livida TaxID=2707176 RepID=A0A7C9TNT9_9BURK|nr:malonyl-CoA decarboxylase [Ideonella livida]NDY93925.1 malonyl-CoA decarboxylase [Ideonella livida]